MDATTKTARILTDVVAKARAGLAPDQSLAEHALVELALPDGQTRFAQDLLRRLARLVNRCRQPCFLSRKPNTRNSLPCTRLTRGIPVTMCTTAWARYTLYSNSSTFRCASHLFSCSLARTVACTQVPPTYPSLSAWRNGKPAATFRGLPARCALVAYGAAPRRRSCAVSWHSCARRRGTHSGCGRA
jgi:hypothetical protein